MPDDPPALPPASGELAELKKQIAAQRAEIDALKKDSTEHKSALESLKKLEKRAQSFFDLY